MASLQDYAVVKVFYDNAPITQITRAARMVKANRQAIQLLNDGLGGFTAGSGECSMEWDAPVPIGGTEFDYEGDCVNGAFVDLQFFIGARSYAGRGKIEQADTEQSTGQATTIKVQWQGEFKATA